MKAKFVFYAFQFLQNDATGWALNYAAIFHTPLNKIHSHSVCACNKHMPHINILGRINHGKTVYMNSFDVPNCFKHRESVDWCIGAKG